MRMKPQCFLHHCSSNVFCYFYCQNYSLLHNSNDETMKLNRFHAHGVTMLQLSCSLYLAFCHLGKVTKKTGTDLLLVAFQLVFIFYFYASLFQISTILTNFSFIPEILMMNWRKQKRSWFGTLVLYLCFVNYLVKLITNMCQFLECSLKEQQR